MKNDGARQEWCKGQHPTYRSWREARAFLFESLRSGTIASLVIVPLSPLFKAAGLRIGHYGPKFAALFVEEPKPWLLLVQHLVIGWISAVPLLLLLIHTDAGRRSMLTGAAYGLAYYVAVNSLALPIYFGDGLPWAMGASVVLPSMFGHIVYGATVGWVSKRFVADRRPSPRLFEGPPG